MGLRLVALGVGIGLAWLQPAAAKKISGGVFGTEDALEARAGELDADQVFASCRRVDNMDDAAGRGEVGFGAARSVARKWNADFEIGADFDVETRDECGAATA